MSPHYDGVTRGAQVTGVAVCSLCLTWISFSLRFYVRLAIVRFVGREDGLTIAAMIIFTIFCALCLRATVYGLGAHVDAIRDASLETGFKIVFIGELLYVLTTTVTKMAIAAYFLRLSSRVYQRRTVYLTLAVVLSFSTAYFFFLIFQCGPISYLWEQYHASPELDGHCVSSTAFAAITYAHCAMSAVTDWVFGILPIFFVWKMQMDPRTKFSIILILSLGFFASTATIVRIVYIARLTHTADYAWDGISLVKWSMVEPAMAITAMNIATLRPLFRHCFRYAAKRFESTTDVDDDAAAARASDLGPDYKREHSVSAQELSAEFANLLGLSRVGVTTNISAGRREPSRRPWRRRSRSRSRSSSAHAWASQSSQSSQTALRVERSPGPSRRELSRGAVNWDEGIKTTTVITSHVQ